MVSPGFQISKGIIKCSHISLRLPRRKAAFSLRCHLSCGLASSVPPGRGRQFRNPTDQPVAWEMFDEAERVPMSWGSVFQIPVFRGASKPILGRTLNAGHFHGQDGLGDVPDPDAPGLEMVQKEGAVAAMIRIASEHAGEVSFVATAPLTNLALAAKIDPTFPQKLKGLYIMGGNTDSRGNTTMCAEFNFAADPEAAYIVLKDFMCPTYIACWEFTCRSKLPWEFCDVWLAQDTDKARFMKRIFQYSMDACNSERFQKEMVDGMGFVSCDSYAMAAAIDDSFITEYEQVAVTVELTGAYTRGMMVLDTLDILKKVHKAFVMKKVDMEKFKALMMAALK